MDITVQNLQPGWGSATRVGKRKTGRRLRHCWLSESSQVFRPLPAAVDHAQDLDAFRTHPVTNNVWRSCDNSFPCTDYASNPTNMRTIRQFLDDLGDTGGDFCSGSRIVSTDV